MPYDPAVGATCLIVRTRDGEDQQCRGAVRRITPLVVDVNGEGFR